MSDVDSRNEALGVKARVGSAEDELLRRIVILIVPRLHTFATETAVQLYYSYQAVPMAEKSNPSSRERDRPTAQSATSEGSGISSAEGDDRSGSAPDQPEETAERDVAAAERGDDALRGRDVKERVKLRSSGSLERLRDRVDNAAHELRRLREENQALSERIKELESRPHVAPQGTFLSLEHDPELLRRKISGFIEAIDRYLENERKRS